MVDTADDNPNAQLPNDLEGKTVSDLQKECSDFQDILKHFESNTLPDDKKLATKVVIEANQYVFFFLLNGALDHLYQPRVKGLPAAQRLIRQLALPRHCRQDILKS